MMNRTGRSLRPIVLVCLLLGATLTGTAFGQALDANVQQQIRELLQEKEGRTHAQRKMGSRLIYAAKAERHERIGSNTDVLTNSLASLDLRGKGALVDIRGTVNTDLEDAIARTGGQVIYSSRRANAIRARVPLNKLTRLAERDDVASVRPASHAKLSGGVTPLTHTGGVSLLPFIPRTFPFAISTGSVTSQGMIAHNAAAARTAFGVDGTGVKVGVLSDSAEATPFLITTGDLPADTMIVADIIDGPGSSEGSAMMEIVHDMAPGAQLFFASAFNSPDSFADNIRLLRNTYHCDVIVDDVSYSDESPFQDSVIAQAVDDVVADGAIYLSSAGNGGNLTNGNSSAWEGDFSDGGSNALLPGYTVHNFGAQTFNRLVTTTGVLDMFWSDPLGNSTNDYDLFVLNSAGTAVLLASTTTQAGAGDDPFEEVFNPNGFPANARVVIAAKVGAQPRALHLDAFFGEPLQLKTSGVSRGHNAGASTVGVAAVAWNSGRPLGIKPFTGGAKNPTEVFSSDGPRRIFYNEDGTAISPGNLLFGTNGGTVLVKPDISAADGVTTRTPGFSPFFGTSAAAPHAAGIAALAKSLNPALTNTEIHNAMTSTALDIRAVGTDRDSGYGIVMAPQTLTALPH